ncbi:MAG: hypothetical protein WA892_08595 [Ornithinimicrobium sp.]
MKPLFKDFEFLDAQQQAGSDYLGGKLGANLFETAGFLVQQGGISKASTEKVYEDGVNPAFAESVKQ